MYNKKLTAGAVFPAFSVQSLGGQELSLGKASEGFDWQMIVVYRGAHCPLCTKYLQQLNEKLDELHGLGIEVLAVSSDPLAKAEKQMEQVGPNFPVGYGMTIEQMQSLGLYISNPRSPEETDAPFAEPGLFIVNEEGLLQVVELANSPIIRPELGLLVGGLAFIKNPENNYPIRGTFE